MSNYENNDELFTPSAEDFTFVQVDKKIYDKKFETKTTTFAKDAFKRFCKNKSSVVGAIIIGVLLVLSFLMPVVIPYDIESPDTAQSLLKPKLFETGTGFWDGTEKYYDVSWNANTESPNGFSKYAVVKIFEDKVDELTNTAKETASGGYVKFVATFAGSGNSKYFQNYTAFPLTRDGGVKVTIKIGNVDNLDGQLGEYRFALYEKTYDEVKKKVSRNIRMKEADFTKPTEDDVLGFYDASIDGKLSIIKGLLQNGHENVANKLLEEIQKECLPEERGKVMQFSKNKKLYKNQNRTSSSK